MTQYFESTESYQVVFYEPTQDVWAIAGLFHTGTEDEKGASLLLWEDYAQE